MEYNFQKADPGTTDSFGVPYNYASVMHYSKYAFSPSGYDETILPLVRKFFQLPDFPFFANNILNSRKMEPTKWVNEMDSRQLIYKKLTKCTIA